MSFHLIVQRKNESDKPVYLLVSFYGYYNNGRGLNMAWREEKLNYFEEECVAE